MRHVFLFCLAFCACARPAAPTTIENRGSAPHVAPSFERNAAAAVTVRYVWRDPMSNDTFEDAQSGIVLDTSHVLTARTSEIAEMIGWNQAALDAVTVGPFDPMNENEYPAWPAAIAAESDDLTILVMTNGPLPFPAVELASRLPVINELVYVISDDTNRERIPAMVLDPHDGAIGVPIGDMRNQVVAYADDMERPRTSVFNQRDEFVGFMITTWCSFTVHDPSQLQFFDGEPSVDGLHVATVQGSLAPLLREAGLTP